MQLGSLMLMGSWLKAGMSWGISSAYTSAGDSSLCRHKHRPTQRTFSSRAQTISLPEAHAGHLLPQQMSKAIVTEPNHRRNVLNTHGKAAAMGTGAVLSTAAEQRCMLQTYHRRRIEKGIAPGGCCT